MNKIIHKLSHFFKLNTGTIVTWENEGNIYVAFQCDCGEIDKTTINSIESDKIYGKTDSDSSVG